MPIEIRELIIKATVGDDSKSEAGANKNEESTGVKESDVNLIVEKVMEVLKEISER